MFNWFTKIRLWFISKPWTDAMVQNAVLKGKLTQEQADAIFAERG